MDNKIINEISKLLEKIRTLQENENPEFEKEFTTLKNNLKKQVPKKHKDWSLDSVNEKFGERKGRNAIEIEYSHKSNEEIMVTIIFSTKTALIGKFKDGHIWLHVEYMNGEDGEYLAEEWIKPKDVNVKTITKYLDKAQKKG